MTVIVQKYGGSCVASIDKIKQVAQSIVQTIDSGCKVVVVVSAMYGETDKLIKMAELASPSPCPREYDALIATGEKQSAALLAIVLNSLGVKSQSFNAAQLGIRTSSVYKRAKITHIDAEIFKQLLQEQQVVVVTGFQGVDVEGNITTLGRGGSDVTAVAIAACINADQCQIFTDVAGVFNADPNVIQGAKLLGKINYAEMLESSALGAKVLQTQAVSLAAKYDVPLKVLSLSPGTEGTLVSGDAPELQHSSVTNIVGDADQVLFTIMDIVNQQMVIEKILKPIEDANIEIDMISQEIIQQTGLIKCRFTVKQDAARQLLSFLKPLVDNNHLKILVDDQVGKLSLVGVGVKSSASVLTKMLTILLADKINLLLISTSEIKVSLLLNRGNLNAAFQLLHDNFCLNSV